MKKYSIKVWVLGITLFVFLIAAVVVTALEAYYNWFDMYPVELLSYDSHTIWKFNSQIKTINSQGFRDFEHDLKPATGVKRVLVLGDSYTAALATDIENAYTTLLAQNLNNNSDQKYEVINAGISGWGTDQQLQYYINDGYKYQADYVILVTSPNDLREAYAKKLCVVHDNKVMCKEDRIPLKVRFKWFLANHSRIYQNYQSTEPSQRIGHILNIFTYYPVHFKIGDSVSWDAPIFMIHPVQEIIEAKQLFNSLIAELDEACKTNGSKLLLATVPTYMEFEGTLDTSVCRPGLFAEEVGIVAKKLNLPYLNLYTKTAEINDPMSLYAMIDLHFSDEGNAFLAKHLTQFVESNL